MPDLRFDWDERKSAANRRKHKVSFEEAQTVFYDDLAIFMEDPDEEEEDEDRFVLIGLSASLRTLVVCHCYREGEDVIRIISARKAHREERRDYDQRWRS
ncbi:MAG: BrnT family toxin [bacterium]|nr:BrnT family toxin [bacterium]